MNIRPATEHDAQAIAAILNPIIAETTITFAPDPVAAQEVLDGIRSHEERGDPYLVIETAKAIVGFAKYGPFRGGAGYAHTVETSLHLATDARGQGLGRALHMELEDHARATGKHSLIAGISAENQTALTFHVKMGFSQVALIPQAGRKFGRYIDLVLMQKFL